MRIPAAFLLLATAGCTSTLNFQPTMASDPPHLGIEGIALANQLAKAYEPGQADGICEKLALGYQESRRHSVKRLGNSQKDAKSIFQCVVFKQKPLEEEMLSHIKAGYALSDYLCDGFFERIAEHSGKRKFARNSVNDVGAMVSTILGLASAGSAITGGVGAGFGLADSAWRNYDENFLVSADLPALQRLVHSEQDKRRDSLNNKKFSNYSDATNEILRYANLCSFVGMKSLLTASMEKKTIENIASTSGKEGLVGSTAEAFMKAYEEWQASKKANPVDAKTPEE